MGPLLDAMRALRVERNPLRARALLTAYLERHPKGELSEEALVMLIEAAAGNHDSDAQALAARYLRLYPQGPFRGMVERMLAATSKGP
jgi:outer membrane protein assembly factor BamD (BamD/ComL family)